MPAGSIDAVLGELDGIIDTCRGRGSADCYFASLYRRVTAAVKTGIERGGFEDGARMERLDVAFANRYLDAWSCRERGHPLTESWEAALGCSREFWPVVLQHLLLGMNAHINLDLGIAAAETAPGPAIHGLKGDFDRINAILAAMIDDVQSRLALIWPAMHWLDRFGGGFDEAFANFSIGRARDQAWRLALALSAIRSEPARAALISATDVAVAAIGRGLRNPGVKASTVLCLIRLRERGTVAAKLDVLFR